MHNAQLQFTRELLANMSISSLVVTDPDNEIPSEIDLGLRALLFGENNYRRILPNSMLQAQDNTVYRFVDEYHCSYIFMKLPEEEPVRFFWIGPYLLQQPSKAFVVEKVRAFDLPDEYARQLSKYYANLPMIQDENLLFIIVRTLGNALWGSSDKFSFEYLEDMFADDVSAELIPSAYTDTAETPLHLRLLERHYASEGELMHAVSQGKLLELSTLNSAIYTQGTEQRLPDTMRNRMNYLIILNTLLRKAAEQGGVHPLHIDRLSSQFAMKIERITSINASIDLQKSMIHKYCLLVRNHSLKQYSSILGRAITLIEYDLTADLSLRALAKQLNINSSYLSSMFRKELHCTLTEFVNRKRMDHAIFLLNSTTMQIQNVAAECGIHDANYFIKLFKRHIGLTPQTYRKQIVQS